MAFDSMVPYAVRRAVRLSHIARTVWRASDYLDLLETADVRVLARALGCHHATARKRVREAQEVLEILGANLREDARQGVRATIALSEKDRPT